ncbi:sensor domain-containing diguanylate cyclase [Pseudoalteromonas sp. 2CM41L]|uniref:sensor domain-containing diguanylate cyclase n=1 Tax=unclassified Pseudoalteromonas TaxID=194690 RepID=UPI0020C0AD06|nr:MULTISPECIES: sensor domain-containing diguanylate cyclase [unclassified Pseudoalteromonas]MCK8108662.1 sensor domain-containing diguanylate cyclase [Pseudoalteromonas sp. 2CM41L]MDC9511860.1 sensor domain-containing diguanylate cyclase [Pseudoalteromonas sp. CST1]MDC9536096.1 sensor domain-containing diguanylate cyclase [Pseudoalteromonas sp. CST3]MDC9540541.1 sensor domain-containing diguanylate cyclase [Pseudoalteromonas sp. CST2]MDC9544441.1 sensor domain-containing diguanylate cyclase 
MIKIISQKLYIRVAIAIALVAIVVTLVSSMLSYYSGFKEKKNTNYLLVQQLAQTMGKTAAIAAYLNDKELSQEIINGLLSNDLVQGASLESEANVKGEMELFIANGTINKQKEAVLVKLVHPFLDDNFIGVLSIYPDDNFIQQQAQAALKKEFILMLIQSIVIAFFVSLVVQRWLTQPIQNLTDSFAKINPSEPETLNMLTFKQGKRDEISRLTHGINALMHELHLTISNEQTLRKKTQELEAKFRLIFEQASAGICLLDSKNNITTFNPAFKHYFTVPGEKELSTLHFPELLNNVDELHSLLEEIRFAHNPPQTTLDVECKVGYKTLWFHCLFVRLTDQRNTNRGPQQEQLVEVILHDVTERAERELKTRFEADHDPLTGLLNRRAGEKRLQKTLRECIKHNKHLVLMMIDLDKFKPINDTYGHEAGDKVLIETAHRFKTLFHEQNDMCIRLGGDEFIVARQVNTFNKAATLEQATTLLKELQQQVSISNTKTCAVGASIGIAVAPTDGTELHELMHNGDKTLYHVKETGRGKVAFYDDIKN